MKTNKNKGACGWRHLREVTAALPGVGLWVGSHGWGGPPCRVPACWPQSALPSSSFSLAPVPLLRLAGWARGDLRSRLVCAPGAGWTLPWALDCTSQQAGPQCPYPESGDIFPQWAGKHLNICTFCSMCPGCPSHPLFLVDCSPFARAGVRQHLFLRATFADSSELAFLGLSLSLSPCFPAVPSCAPLHHPMTCTGATSALPSAL